MMQEHDFPESWACDDCGTIAVPHGIATLTFACPAECVYPSSPWCAPGQSLVELIAGSDPAVLRELIQGIDAYRDYNFNDWLRRRLGVKRRLITEFLED